MQHRMTVPAAGYSNPLIDLWPCVCMYILCVERLREAL